MPDPGVVSPYYPWPDPEDANTHFQKLVIASIDQTLGCPEFLLEASSTAAVITCITRRRRPSAFFDYWQILLVNDVV
jgi:hypothetical protein